TLSWEPGSRKWPDLGAGLTETAALTCVLGEHSCHSFSCCSHTARLLREAHLALGQKEGHWETGAFFTKVVDVGTASLKFEIWDTAGQEKYHSVCHLYFRGANAALLVYDITSKDSFCRAQQWLKDLEKEFLPGEVVVMLVGNKTDLGEKREVTFEEGKEFAERQNLLFMETSAKLNHQVTEAFSAIARELLQREERKEGPMPPRGDARLALGRGPAGQAKCCAR
uniref:Ras-related protein Rab-17 n=1 Tax=Rhinolophus ferrumequinum TaxID=59479 RepID=A0A671DVP7_RHIFE